MIAEEVIGERIRHRFPASRRKGIWMCGTVPFGYGVEKRTLLVRGGGRAVCLWLTWLRKRAWQ